MATLLAWLTAFAKIVPFLDRLAEIFQGSQQKAAGRNEVIIEQQEATNAEIDKAIAARRDQSARDAVGGVSDVPDKYLRD